MFDFNIVYLYLLIKYFVRYQLKTDNIMKRLYTLLSMLFVVGFLNAQTITHSVVAAAGASHTNTETGYSMSWTLGEPVIGTLVSSDNTIIITQGFQQGPLGIVSINAIEFTSEIMVYPNPATSLVNIKVDGLSSGSLNLEIIDIHGRIRATRQGIMNDDIVTINTDNLNPGFYMLTFFSEGRTVKTVRLVKQ